MAPAQDSPSGALAPLSRLTVVLHRTRSVDNVGAAVRALANMGLGRLILADPSGFDLGLARRAAAEAADALTQVEVAPELDGLLPRFTRVVATTGRPRQGLEDRPLPDAAAWIVEALQQGHEVALVFGNERNGLPRELLDRAHLLSRVPTEETHASLNLAQAVLLHGWELRRLLMEQGAPAPGPPAPPLAAPEQARLLEGARQLLTELGFLNPQAPQKVFGELERLLLRAQPTAREGQLLLALVHKLLWGVQRR